MALSSITMNSLERFIIETPIVIGFVCGAVVRCRAAPAGTARQDADRDRQYATTQKPFRNRSMTTGKNAHPTAAVGWAITPDRGFKSLETASNVIHSFPPPVEPHRAHDDNAFDDLLVVGRDVQEIETIVDHAYQDRTRGPSRRRRRRRRKGWFRQSPRRRWRPAHSPRPRWAGRS